MVFITNGRVTTEEFTSRRMKMIPEGRSEKEERKDSEERSEHVGKSR